MTEDKDPNACIFCGATDPSGCGAATALVRMHCFLDNRPLSRQAIEKEHGAGFLEQGENERPS